MFIKEKVHWKLFKALFLLNSIWFVVSLLRSSADTLFYNQGGKVFSSFSIHEILSFQLISDFLLYLLASLFLYFIHAVFIGVVSIVYSTRRKLNENGTSAVLMLTWVCSVYLIFALNNQLYIRSAFNHSEAIFFNGTPGNTLLILSGLWLSFITLYSFVSFLQWIFQRKIRVLKTASLIVFVAISGMTVLSVNIDSKAKVASEKPNIIIIGIDSLRPDYLYGKYKEENHTPAIRNFLENSIRFENAVTPLARTFPAWVSILTGLNPVNDGARVNLIEPSRVKREKTISRKLQKAGYKTVYAIDERRFSNIDETYGFDKIIGPKVGVLDFILGKVNDSPLSNLVSNTVLGQWLFPYTYANRAASKTYDPASFDKLVNKGLEGLQKEGQPFFLGIHYCLPHWPFTWADSEEIEWDRDPETVNYFRRLKYNATLERVDEQFKNLIDNLETKGLLDNALVIVLSDHGEGHGNDPGFIEQSPIDEKVTPLHTFSSIPDWGHGTSIISSGQDQVILAFRKFGGEPVPPAIIKERVSLIDITPTIADYLSLDTSSTSFDGMSLLPWINGGKTQLPERMFSVESGFSMDSILAANPAMEKVFKEGMRHYRIDPQTGHLIVRDESLKEIMHTKQRGIISGDWLLMHMNSITGEDKGYLGVFNMQKRIWTRDLNMATQSGAPVDSMMSALNENFAGELH